MGENGWSLEVVRGRQAGRSYALTTPETVLGNALSGRAGIDLGDQEGDSPRRMAARQAVLSKTPAGLSVRDLESPGGTFVNRQRVLPGQSVTLRPGDVIQVGGVQLRVVGGSNGRPISPAASPTSAPPSSPFVTKNGAACRTWDDFLRVAAQRWGDLRDELTSSRLAAWLSTIGRPDLVVHPAPGATADEHLDAWLARLPTTTPARPELEVHPARLVIRVAPGGGTLLRSVQVANVGHRLLHVRASIEPAGAWVVVSSPFADGPQTVVDATHIPLQIAVPASLPRPLRATLRLDGDGGSKAVELILEAKTASDSVAPPPRPVGPGFRGRLSKIPATTRLVGLGPGGVALRLVVALAGGIGSPPVTPGLTGVAALFALSFGVVGAFVAGRRGGISAVGPAAASAAVAGCGVAAVVVAACRVIEPVLGAWSASPVASSLLWGALGAVTACLSLWLAPPRSAKEEATR